MKKYSHMAVFNKEESKALLKFLNELKLDEEKVSKDKEEALKNLKNIIKHCLKKDNKVKNNYIR